MTGFGVSGLEQEPHVSGVGMDRYKYSKCTIVKNKAFPPMRVAELRIWFSEQDGIGRGIDPVHDIFTYLKSTGQIEAKKLSYKINIPGFEGAYTWPNFKKMVLKPGNYGTLAGMELYDDNLPDIREVCYEQLLSGNAFMLERKTNLEGKEIKTYVMGKITEGMYEEKEKGKKELVGVMVTLDDGSTRKLKSSKIKEKTLETLIGKHVKVPL
jgi:hypothetical protein